MCGILGWVGVGGEPEAVKNSARPALEALRRRGPDGSRLEAGPGWLLGHTRLAILDLTERASQPMTDGEGHWLVYNGEVYNFEELRRELEARGARFQSTGDAEVVLYAMREWGVACLGRLRGMFAFGWLDAGRRELILARDRYGVKPLAYEHGKDDFRFASDLFALRALPGGSREIDSESAYLYLGLGYVPNPRSILKRVRKVRPGHYLRVRWSEEGFDVQEYAYWSMSEVAAASEPGRESRTDLLERYEELVGEAVRYRLISDVPVGSLLSGGIDSTLVTAFSRQQPGAEVPSFTMGFEDPRADEAPFAREVAKHLGGKHTEFRIREEEVLKIWDGLWGVYDEPFADSSALPMVALCRLVAPHVKVGLTGDGGDEAFCGYPWHRALGRLNGSRQVPGPVRRLIATMTATVLPSFRYKALVFSQVDRVAQWSALRTGLSEDTARLLPVEHADERAPLSEYFRQGAQGLKAVTDPLDWACRMDLLTYLPDDLMVKADRASMSVGLELREPLLDHDLTTWCLRLPVTFRYDQSAHRGKVFPRDLLERRVPKDLWERPKQGSATPFIDSSGESLPRCGCL
ncbi:MAG: asparagine synthase (glutamine-hydrolyzing) [Candidatus Tectomicrobia bacterium]|uniref:asparagine synthase (glutamine-hydrolyzing) n=1 Tax=Tectimicrobiota bacterium TaxID=2528274 RepID=A0A932GQ38_UNCTE|nr:asparagine synthase (glutamine-hydrolyzing) [Candidatus Tectomicrobia bacterium]